MESTVGTQQFYFIYCDLMLCTTPACFSTFFQSTMVPTLVENSSIITCLLTFYHQTVWSYCLSRDFELPAALLQYFDLLQGGLQPPCPTPV